jgi:hypothetical protein
MRLEAEAIFEFELVATSGSRQVAQFRVVCRHLL